MVLRSTQLAIVFISLILLYVPQALSSTTVTLGVFAYRDKPFVGGQFKPAADAIQRALPGTNVQLEVLTLDELDKAIAESRVDFVLTNPRHFLAIRQKYRVSGALATLQKPQGGHMLSSLAGVILVQSDTNISSLSDLQNKVIGIPGKRFLGGYLTQAYELQQKGYNPKTFATYKELGSHDAVMQALVNGEIEAGFVRTGILEDWHDTINHGDLRVITPRSNLFYPLARSTRLYPEWAFAAMPDVPMDSIRRVTNALLNLQVDPLAKNSQIGFDPPQDYLQVETAARALGLPPFARMPIWDRLKEQYGSGLWVLVALSVALLITLITLVYLYLNKNRLYRRFNILFYFSPSAKLLLYADRGRGPVITEANNAAARLFGYADTDSLVGMPIEKLSPPVQPDGASSYRKATEILAKASTTPTQFSWEHRNRKNEKILTQVTILRFSDPRLFKASHHGPSYLVALQDVTQQMHDQKSLEDERNTLQNILWGTAAGTWEWNVQTGDTRFNERWAEMVGYKLSELQPTTIETWLSLCHPDDQSLSETRLNEHFAGERDSYDVELRMRHRDGHWIWVQDRGRVVSRTDTGQPLLMAGTHSDITQRKLAEARVQEMMSQLRKHAALLPGTLYQYQQYPDGRARFPYASQGIFNIYGVTPEQVLDDATPVFKVIEPEDVNYVSEAIQASMDNLTTWRSTYRVNHPQGNQLWVEGIATPERLEDGSTIWHGYLHDVTEEHATQLQLEEYRNSLEVSNRDLEHFAYAASHDLRQPLRMITSYAQLLDRHLAGQLDEDGETMLHYMKDGAQRIDAMLLSLLAYSRVGRKGQPMQRFSLEQAFDEALHFLKPEIDEISPEIHIEGQWPEVMASPDEMTRLFQNLIGNALKYRHPDNTPLIQLTITQNVADKHWIFRLCDNGIGIAPEQIDRLFQVFQRLHTRQQYEGNGIGLAICRKIVERHDGRIWVESEGEGHGSCFVFTLPVMAKATEEMACD